MDEFTYGEDFLKPPPSGAFAVDLWTPIRRTFWQWLRRSPVEYFYVCIPYATSVPDNPNGYTITRPIDSQGPPTP